MVGFGYRASVMVDMAERILAAADQSGRLAGPLTGDQFTEGASAEEEYCGCGEPITMYDGEWLHIINPVLRGTDDHHAHPA